MGAGQDLLAILTSTHVLRALLHWRHALVPLPRADEPRSVHSRSFAKVRIQDLLAILTSTHVLRALLHWRHALVPLVQRRWFSKGHCICWLHMWRCLSRIPLRWLHSLHGLHLLSIRTRHCAVVWLHLHARRK